jgi:transcriptional regulator with XRE-family HTH domain
MARKKSQEAPSVTDQLREAILQSGQSLNQLSKASGVDSGRLSRFVRKERDLTLDAVDKICRALGYHLEKDKPRRARKADPGNPDAS